MLKIALGDLRHKTLGRHSTLIPLGISLIASYCYKTMGSNVDIRLYDDPDKILDDIDVWKPDVVGLTNFMWNASVNRIVYRAAKKANPVSVCIGGGPEFPIAEPECEKFLQARPELDYFACLEGEVVFSDLVADIFAGKTLDALRAAPRPGLMAISPETGRLVWGGFAPRIRDLDLIPSPYVTGILDEWLDGNNAASVQSARGCPYICTYCRAGAKIYSKVHQFSLERVKEELTYIAERVGRFKGQCLYLLDSNFGLFDRDELIANHLSTLQEKYGWPETIVSDTAKVNRDVVFNISKKLNFRLSPCCSLQSLNPATIKAISRKNPSREDYLKIQGSLVKEGIKPATELIVPLPEESKETFRDGIRFIYEAGTENITSFTFLILPGTEIASSESRKKFGIQSGFRIIPRQFGEYRGEKCFETEEICYATNTMSFDDYIECRWVAFLCYLFARSQFDIVKRHITELGIPFFDFIEEVHAKLMKNQAPAGLLFRALLDDTRGEIFPSRESLKEAFSLPGNYGRLLKGEAGDNLFRLYMAKVLSEGFSSFVGIVYEVLAQLGSRGNDGNKLEALESSRRWLLLSRSFSALFFDPSSVQKREVAEFPYDVEAWYRNGDKDLQLWNYQKAVQIAFYYEDELFEVVRQLKVRFGDDPHYCIGKALVEFAPERFWRKRQYLA